MQLRRSKTGQYVGRELDGLAVLVSGDATRYSVKGKGEDAEEVPTSTCDAQLRIISLGGRAPLSLVTQPPPQPGVRARRVSSRHMKDVDARPTSNEGCTPGGAGTRACRARAQSSCLPSFWAHSVQHGCG